METGYRRNNVYLYFLAARKTVGTMAAHKNVGKMAARKTADTMVVDGVDGNSCLVVVVDGNGCLVVMIDGNSYLVVIDGNIYLLVMVVLDDSHCNGVLDWLFDPGNYGYLCYKAHPLDSDRFLH